MLTLGIIAATLGFVAYRLYRTDMDVPDSAEQFVSPETVEYWQQAELAKHYAIQAGNGKQFIWKKPQ